MEGYDRWLARYRRSTADAWCPNTECQYHDGTTVTVEEEYGQSWATPEECPLCNSEWLYEPPGEKEWKPFAKAITTTENGKLGDASTTYVAQQSCPDSCVFLNAGCYAERGFVGMHLTRMLNVAGGGHGPLEVAQAEAEALDEMATVVDRPMRLHTVGDCSTDEAAGIVSAAAERYMDRGGGLVWTYTHAWRDVERQSWGRVSVLASCETRADVEAAASRGYATAIVVDHFRSQARYEHDGIDLLPCPEMTRKVPCSECRLCFDDVALRERGYSIGFQIHGDPVTKRWAHSSLKKRF